MHFPSHHGQTTTASGLLGVEGHPDTLAAYPCMYSSLYVQFLYKEYNVVRPDDAPSTTPLRLAIAHGHQAAVQFLLQHGPDTSKLATALVDSYVSSALCITAAKCMFRPLRCLAERHVERPFASDPPRGHRGLFAPALHRLRGRLDSS